MKLNHVNLTVEDVPAARDFLARHFGLRPEGEGHKNFGMLIDDAGLVLTLMGVGETNEVVYPKTFHLGFILPDEASVNDLHASLRADGFAAEAPSRQHGAWGFSIQAPGGFRIAVRG
jgi:catechol 2,3-dioxygenase-like lactoylglutathione lyase family enzyme